MSRRELLRWGALVAATPLLSARTDSERAYAATAAAAVVPMNLELVTVTEASIVVTWYTGAAGSSDEFGRLSPAVSDGELLLGTSPERMRQVYASPTPTPYHYAEVHGLEPGQTYFYSARSGGVPAVPATFSPGNPAGSAVASGTLGTAFAFRTPRPPRGRFLFSVVLCNDLHLGETTAGLITTQAGMQVPPGFRQVPGEPPYPEVMAQALVQDARARQASFLLAAGDVSSEAVPAQLADARRILDRFGSQGTDYFLARGNHDRSHAGPEYNHCQVDPRGPGLHDCYRDAFSAREPTWYSTDVLGLRILALDTYDKIGNGGDNGALSAAQFAFVRAQLAAEPDRPTLVFGHHPVSQEASATTAEPIFFDLDPLQSLELQQLYRTSPGVFLHHQGHTHRNKRTSSPLTPGVTYQEVCATKEYPGGFHLLRVHAGGYALNFYKTRGNLAREWSERTRQETFTSYPFYTLGSAADRNCVVDADFSGLGKATRGGPETGASATREQHQAGSAGAYPSGSRPGSPEGEQRSGLAATGGLPLAKAAVAAVAAGTAAREVRKHFEP
ncbi:MAG: hypothetical protein NVS3B26_30290 [Mycobacteriales bacterium]